MPPERLDLRRLRALLEACAEEARAERALGAEAARNPQPPYRVLLTADGRRYFGAVN